MLYAKKSLGQNFLVNPHILDLIVSSANISKDDLILEIGPGTGNLTKKLAEKAGRVVAIEKDHRLIEPLKEIFKNHSGVEIIEGDILEFQISTILKDSKYKIVANIPYYLTSHLIKDIFEKWSRLPVEDPRFAKGESGPQPELIVLTIQKEVAQRMIAKPPHTNLLALSVQYYAKPEIIKIISKNNFRPVPKVDSAIIRLRPLDSVPADREQTQKLFDLMRAGFGEKRKQLARILALKLNLPKGDIMKHLQKIGLSPTSRAENLTLEQWILLKSYLF